MSHLVLVETAKWSKARRRSQDLQASYCAKKRKVLKCVPVSVSLEVDFIEDTIVVSSSVPNNIVDLLFAKLASQLENIRPEVLLPTAKLSGLEKLGDKAG